MLNPKDISRDSKDLIFAFAAERAGNDCFR